MCIFSPRSARLQNELKNAAQGPYVRFFQQAFEWEQMTWLTYP